jgi:hypothetical protein
VNLAPPASRSDVIGVAGRLKSDDSRSPGRNFTPTRFPPTEEESMTTIILNYAPYGTEFAYNGLRLALALAKRGEELNVFLLGDGALCAVEQQQTPEGYYNIARMLKSLAKRKHQVYY